jgi:invasion protein IalB
MVELGARITAIALVMGLANAGALAQSGEGAGGTVPKPAKPSAKPSPTKDNAAKPDDAKKAAAQAAPAIVGNYGQWALVCGKPNQGQGVKESCSLVQALVERDSQKLVFRIILSYGPQGNLVLRVDGPTGVALQRGIEFTTNEKPDAGKIYRLPFQTCVAQGCRALLIVPEDLKGELKTSAKGTLRVFTLDGRPVQTGTDFSGFAEGLAALDKRRQAQVN